MKLLMIWVAAIALSPLMLEILPATTQFYGILHLVKIYTVLGATWWVLNRLSN